MFEEIPHSAKFRLSVLLAHQFIAPVVLFVLVSSLRPSEFSEIIGWSLGLPLGMLIASRLPRYSKEGSWVWLFPFVTLLIGLVYDLSNFPAAHVFADYFLLGKKNPTGRQGLGLSLITLPVWGACCYSAGVALARRRRPVKQVSAPSSQE
jgi:hypothetical protein